MQTPNLAAPGYKPTRRANAIEAAQRLLATEPPGTDAHIVAEALLREAGVVVPRGSDVHAVAALHGAQE